MTKKQSKTNKEIPSKLYGLVVYTYSTNHMESCRHGMYVLSMSSFFFFPLLFSLFLFFFFFLCFLLCTFACPVGV